jgi:hypothetical protein
VSLGRFSLFALAPIVSLILLVLLLWPNMWARLTGGEQEETPVTQVEVSTASAD